MDDWHWTLSLNQARAVAFGISHFRGYYPLNRGTIVWQLNDNWPVISSAAVDSHGIRRPLWYELREAERGPLRDHPATARRRRGTATLRLHNDTDGPTAEQPRWRSPGRMPATRSRFAPLI